MTTGRPWPSITATALVVAAVAFALGRRTAPARTAASNAASAQLATIDPVLLAPHGTRFVLAADVARLLAAPALAPYVAQWRSDTSCQVQIALRMRRIVAFARNATLDDLVFVFDGPVSRDELSQCLRRDERSRASARTVEYRGFSLTQHAVERDPALLPKTDVNELAQIAPTMLIAGPSAAVRATLDRALAPPSNTSEALIPPLKTLTDRLASGYSFALVSLVDSRGSGRFESLLANIEGVAVGLTANERLRAEAILACPNFDSPRVVANMLSAQQLEIAREPILAPARALIERASFERRAADVRATIDLSADEVALTFIALRDLAGALFAPGPYGPREPPLDVRTVSDAAPPTRDASAQR